MAALISRTAFQFDFYSAFIIIYTIINTIHNILPLRVALKSSTVMVAETHYLFRFFLFPRFGNFNKNIMIKVVSKSLSKSM